MARAKIVQVSRAMLLLPITGTVIAALLPAPGRRARPEPRPPRAATGRTAPGRRRPRRAGQPQEAADQAGPPARDAGHLDPAVVQLAPQANQRGAPVGHPADHAVA